MKAHEITASNTELDKVLVKLCAMIIDNNNGQHSMVGAAVVDPKGRQVLRLGTLVSEDPELWRHAERTAIDAYKKEYGELPNDTVIVTTLSPCSTDTMELRYEHSCTQLLEEMGIDFVYCGYMDPTQENTGHQFTLEVTKNPKLNELCEKIGQAVLHRDQEHLKENFADGKNPGRKGLAKRSGVNCKASVSTLRNVAKHSSGEKQRMAHWCANMKSGRSKK